MGMLSLLCSRKCRLRTWKRRCLSTASIVLTVIIILNLNTTSDQQKGANRKGFQQETTETTSFLSGGSSLRGDAVPAWLVRKLLASPGGQDGANFLSGPLLYDLDKKVEPASTNWTCLNSSTVPSTPVCIYAPEEDRYVSAQLAADGVWEPVSTALFQSALRQYRRALVLDMGANVGWYTLLAARAGHRVLAVEPVRDSVVRLQAAAQLAGTARRIALIPRAVSDVRGQLMTFRYKLANKGGTSVRPVSRGEIGAILARDSYGVVSTVTMDDLADILNSSMTVIVKMDIEGYECRALAKSSRFFNKHFVPYVFMEWETMFRNRRRYGAACKPEQMQAAVESMVALGYVPTAAGSGRELDPVRAAMDWRLGDVVWKHRSAPSLPIQR